VPCRAKRLLRFLTAGSVDDGKSTLIGRLLYESQGIYEDQLDSVRKASQERGRQIDLSLVTDGLRAEREQAITIDVAYRYFSTNKRKFIIADTPGHEEYTRNMVTGASTADLAVLLVDAQKGLLPQTRRHAYIIWLLGIRCVVLAVNKMDLTGYSEQVFSRIRNEFEECTAFMKGAQKHFIPISALVGENVVRPSANIRWYTGPTLLELLEAIDVENNLDDVAFRFPVQSVIRSSPNFRGYAGQIASGTVRRQQEVVALPSGHRTRIREIMLYKQSLQEASSPQSVALTLEDHIDLGRGDMLVDPRKMPAISNRFIAELIWMSPVPLRTNALYLLKQHTRVLCCSISNILDQCDIHRFSAKAANILEQNDIGRVEIETHQPMFFEPYSANRAMGGFILIDPDTNDTIAAGIISEQVIAKADEKYRSEPSSLLLGQPAGLIVWFTGLSGAGKSTICNAVYVELLAQGIKVEILDGDVIRNKLNNDLGFSPQDRCENIRRIAFVAQLLAKHGIVVLVAAISPYRDVRAEIRRSIPYFLEVYVNAPLKVCEERDPKGLYKRARNGEIAGFTGIDDPYQPPLLPEVECKTDRESVKACTARVRSAIFDFFVSRRQSSSAVIHPTASTHEFCGSGK
jgi:bifunctional enzyme CysN/CysC